MERHGNRSNPDTDQIIPDSALCDLRSENRDLDLPLVSNSPAKGIHQDVDALLNNFFDRVEGDLGAVVERDQGVEVVTTDLDELFSGLMRGIG